MIGASELISKQDVVDLKFEIKGIYVSNLPLTTLFVYNFFNACDKKRKITSKTIVRWTKALKVVYLIRSNWRIEEKWISYKEMPSNIYGNCLTKSVKEGSRFHGMYSLLLSYAHDWEYDTVLKFLVVWYATLVDYHVSMVKVEKFVPNSTYVVDNAYELLVIICTFTAIGDPFTIHSSFFLYLSFLSIFVQICIQVLPIQERPYDSYDSYKKDLQPHISS